MKKFIAEGNALESFAHLLIKPKAYAERGRIFPE
jgi:hypothetical protein